MLDDGRARHFSPRGRTSIRRGTRSTRSRCRWRSEVGSQLTLQWFLTAAGIPSERAQALVFGALKRFGWWAPLTAVEIGEIAERVARDALSPTGIVPTGRIDNWPDTWPHGWPSWRATNTGWGAGSPSDRGHSA